MKTAYVVLGMHRSGTSLVAGCLHEAGVDFGRNLIPSNEFNPTGYWELSALNVTHDRLLRSAGLAWDAPAVLPEGWFGSEEASRGREDLADMLRSEFDGVETIGLKDPRMCRFLPLWKKVFGDLGVRVRWIFVFRNPEAVAASLGRRGGMPRCQALALWASHNWDVLAGREPEDDWLTLAAEDFLADPVGNTRRCLGGDWLAGSDPALVEKRVGAFCRPDLQHTAADADPGGGPSAALYRALRTDPGSAGSMAEQGRMVLASMAAESRRLAGERERMESAAVALARGKPTVVAQFYPMDDQRTFTEWETAYAAIAPSGWTEVDFACDAEDFRGKDWFRIDPANAPGEVRLIGFRLVASSGEECPVDLSACVLRGDAREVSRSPESLVLHSLGPAPQVLVSPPAAVPGGPLRLRGRIHFVPRLADIARLADELKSARDSLGEKVSGMAKLKDELASRVAGHRRMEKRFHLLKTALSERLKKEFFDVFFAAESPKASARREELRRAVGGPVDPEEFRRGLAGILQEGLFDFEEYISSHPDVWGASWNPFAHYLLHGWREGRRPSRRFDPGFYLEAYPDVRLAGTEPLFHYWIHGRAEGRATAPPPLVRANADEGKERHGSGSGDVVPGARPCVVFYSGEPGTPGHTYRIERLCELLPPDEFEVVRSGPGLEEAARVALDRADWLWIWRGPVGPVLHPLIEEARRKGVRIHFDLDDLMIRPELADPVVIDGIRSMELRKEETFDLYARTQQAFLLSDQASAPTSPLVAEMSRFYIPTLLLPNGFSSRELVAAREARRERPDDGRIRIGYACGSRTHQRDFRRVLPGLLRVLRGFPETVFVTFPDAFLLREFPELDAMGDRIERRSMVPVSGLIREYARFDINLAPVETGNRFCEAKSELKYFEAALVGTPTIASPVRPFRDAIRSGVNGLLADSEEEWSEALASLVADGDLRRRLADRAAEEVLWNFGPHRRGLLLRQALLTGARDPAATGFEWAHHLEKLRAMPVRPRSAGFEVLFREERHCRSRVTVVMPVHNYAHYVEEALGSVERQTLADLDLVVVDDGSTDDSVEVVLSWLRRSAARFGSASLLRHRTNAKLGAARNTGVRFAETEFFFPLDPDNWLLAPCLETCLHFLDPSPAAFAYPDLEVVGSDRHVITGVDWHPLRFASGNYIDAMALVRKSVWVALGGYTADPDLLGWEDFDFWCKAVEGGFHGKRIPLKLASYRIHDRSMLKEITDQSDFKRGILEKMETLHPWLDLSRE
ncbi:MAG: glycosyltransferase [Puniceicoccaceae bacterium]